MMNKERKYFTEDELPLLAEYLGMTLEQFLEKKKRGRFGVQPRPLDPTPVYHVSDIIRWIAGGKPPQSNSPDPAGVLAINPLARGT